MSIRLINTSTLRMKTFAGNAIPQYAILSHTWIDDDEVSFQEMTRIIDDLNHPATQTGGYQKIYSTCQKAKSHGIKYAWVDTCCIDKTSSAELSEAINSMFKWYQNAEVCYVFLSDLPPDPITSDLCGCRWFTRGWCLQELIAPRNVRFYDRKWGFFGTKLLLKDAIADITKIDEAVLVDSSILRSMPVARKMSWASSRTTTRVEDIAYCLLGIFDVNIPMLYGEGENAFMRLQEEIVKRSNDLSIFRCFPTTTHSRSIRTDGGYYSYRNLFALSPAEFAECGNVSHDAIDTLNTRSFSLTNSGIHFGNAEFHIVTSAGEYRCYGMSLDYGVMFLRKVGPAHFVRLDERLCDIQPLIFESLETELPELFREEAYIVTSVSASMCKQLDLSHDHSIRIDVPSRVPGHTAIQGPVPREWWDTATMEFLTGRMDKFEGYVMVYPNLLDFNSTELDVELQSQHFYLACGFDNSRGWPNYWVRTYSSDDWTSHQRRFGKIVDLRYLKGWDSPEGFKKDELRIGSTYLRAQIEMVTKELVSYVVTFSVSKG